MGEENLGLKKKLILQSFLPLFILILIKYFDFRAIVSAVHFFQHLSRGEFTIVFSIAIRSYYCFYYMDFERINCNMAI